MSGPAAANPSPDELRRMIDEALDEIEAVEADMLGFLGDVLGPEHARLVAGYIEAATEQPRAAPLRRGAWPGSSTEPPGTR